MKFFKSPWSWVLLMFVVVSWGGSFISRPLDWFDYQVLKNIPSDNERVLSAVRIFNILILPLILTYFVANYFLNRKTNKYKY